MTGRGWIPYLLGFVIGASPLLILWVVGEWICQAKPELWVAVPIGVRYSTGDSASTLVLPEEVTPQLFGSILAAEDADFMYHFGIDLYGMARAILRNIESMRFKEGGSTLTQQLARNVYLTQRKTLTRKLLEIAIALHLEASYDKYELLAAYLSTVYTGEAGIGLKKAARYYFGKNIDDITWNEAVGLMGLLRSPGLYSPFKSPKNFELRARAVARLLLEKGLYDHEVDPVLPKAKATERSPTRELPYWMKNLAIAEAAKHLGISKEEFLARGYTLKLSVDPRLQKVASAAIEKVKEYHPAVLVVEGFTGRIIAAAGNEYDVLFSKRQMGSLIKPLYYLEGFLQHVITPRTMIADIPLKLGNWEPQNFDKRFRGIVTVEKALRLSLNVPSVRVYLRVGPFRSLDFIRNKVKLEGDYPNDLTVSLGTVESTPWEVLEAYTFIANGGVKTKLSLVDEITDRFGNPVYVHRPVFERVEAEGIVPWGDALETLKDILRNVVRGGTGVKALVRGIDMGGKTGTARRDAWFFSWTGRAVGLVSIHWDEPLNLTGGGNAAPVWREIAESLPLDFTRPPKRKERFTTKGSVESVVDAIPEVFNRYLRWPMEAESFTTLLDRLLNASESERNKMLSEINARDPQLASQLWREIRRIRGGRVP